MARKVIEVVIDDEGRDLGKRFVITEMPALRAEKWAFRTLAALAKSGVEIPEDVQAMGMAAIAAIGFQALAGIDFRDAEPLLDEMLSCLQIKPDPKHPQVIRPLVEDDMEEIVTILRLRREVFGIHTDFFERAAKSKST